MEWSEYLQAVANRKEPVEGLQEGKPLSNAEREALLAVFRTQYEILTFVQAGQAIHKDSKTLTTQFQSIYSKFTIDPATPAELGKLLRIGFEKLTQKELQQEQGLPTTPIQNPPTPQIDWLDRSHQLLAAQKHLTTNGLLKDSTRNFDHIHVPLGLIERKERPEVKEEPSPEQGSQLYQTEYTETKRFEHEAFLDEVVGNRVAGKHIAIIGEPGAGKTTILTKIGEYLIQQAEEQPEQPFVVAWVSLASLDKPKLSEYFYTTWLTNAHPAACPAPSWKDELVQLVEQRSVWLLLDGLDEMSGDALGSICLELKEASWAQNLRVVMTCRINQWEAAAGGNILTNSFDVYRTLDYSYQTSQGEDQVEKFISNWFGDKEKEVAHQIRRELDAPGKERIKDLVKNPLRLTLLCASWEQDNQALPETQADLYRGFVNYLYGWKAREFQEEAKLKDKLNLALGELAKAGLNRASINDGAVRRFRFTASEIRKSWQDLTDTLLPAAKNLGWLNVVGEEAKEDLYAFYHPTFQEYFAACSIGDWDYFLPRAHIDRPVPCLGEEEIEPTYRVFESEWRQPMVLWFGRGDVADENKEKFIEKLTTFQDGIGDFYYYRAYCIAAIGTGEFKTSNQHEKVVQQIIKWAFGYRTEKQEWMTYIEPLSSLARDIIPFVHREYAIKILLIFLTKYDLSHIDCPDISRILAKIAFGNEFAIQYLVNTINSSKWDKSSRDFRRTVMFLLNKIYTNEESSDWDENQENQIKTNSEEIIEYLNELLREKDLINFNYLVFHNLKYRLEKVFVFDTRIMQLLIEIIENNNIHLQCKKCAVETIGRIATDHENTIFFLSNLLDDLDWGGSGKVDMNQYYFSVAEALANIEIGNKQVITFFINLLEGKIVGQYDEDRAMISLGKVGMGNSYTIEYFIKVLENNDYREQRDLYIIKKQLAKIMTISFMPLVIWRLKHHVKNGVNELYPAQFQVCSEILFQCAQTITYPEFHTAWHQTQRPHSRCPQPRQ